MKKIKRKKRLVISELDIKMATYCFLCNDDTLERYKKGAIITRRWVAEHIARTIVMMLRDKYKLDIKREESLYGAKSRSDLLLER